MTTTKRSQVHTAHSIKDKQLKNMLDSAVEAVIELGQAAENLKQSIEHIQRAQKKAKPVTDPVIKAATRTASAVRKTVSRRS